MKSSERGETIEQLIMTEILAIKITINGEVLFEILKNVPTRKIIFLMNVTICHFSLCW